MSLVKNLSLIIILITFCYIYTIKCDDFLPRKHKPHKCTLEKCIIPQNKECSKSDGFRSFDGSCNNLQYSTWGMANTFYHRFLPNRYSDGISNPRLSVSGAELPLARLLSYEIFDNNVFPNPEINSDIISFGQLIANDMSHQLSKNNFGLSNPSSCCANGIFDKNKYNTTACFPILIPDSDPYYDPDNVQCLLFDRSVTGKDLHCPGKFCNPVNQINEVTAFLDLSNIYGNSIAENKKLREFKDGRMLVSKGNFLPNQAIGCSQTSTVCFKTGDSRANQNLHLAVFQTIFVREHNRICGELKKLNPHYNDDKLFQIAREINIGQYQFIVYYRYLPIILGTDNMFYNGLLYKKKKFIDDYDPTINPSVIHEHAMAAFKFLHSTIIGDLSLVEEDRTTKSTVKLSDYIDTPDLIVDNNNLDYLIRGMATEPANYAGKSISIEATLFFPKNLIGNDFGTDMKALDIQRDRDHGLATYNDAREACGFKRAYKFQDFSDFISPENIELLEALYESPEDIDLTVGGSLEILVPNTSAGPTNLCVLTEQFYRTRVGDRWFFEGENVFNKEQLNEIRKASLASIFCLNSNSIQGMQPFALKAIDDIENYVVDCADIVKIDLEKWKDSVN